MKNILLFISSLLPCLTIGQFAPKPGHPGSTAIRYDSSVFVGWGNEAVLNRGYKQINLPNSGFAVAGQADFADGRADGETVSLGDGGSVTLRFDPPIVNGPSWDLAVFENGFTIRNDSDFLELAFVEVSSDGENFYRFPALSERDTVTQLGPFGGSKAFTVHNLAGKYIGLYGVPFDLEELKNEPGLDVNRITYVRVVDVVGSLTDSLCTRDAQGRKINDPFPTLFNQGGFDLDAVGAIHNEHMPNGLQEFLSSLKIYPNPAREGLPVSLPSESPWQLTSLRGELVLQGNGSTLELPRGISPGLYILSFEKMGHSVHLRLNVQ